MNDPVDHAAPVLLDAPAFAGAQAAGCCALPAEFVAANPSESFPGVLEATIEEDHPARLRVRYDPSTGTVAAIVAALDDAGIAGATVTQVSLGHRASAGLTDRHDTKGSTR